MWDEGSLMPSDRACWDSDDVGTCDCDGYGLPVGSGLVNRTRGVASGAVEVGREAQG